MNTVHHVTFLYVFKFSGAQVKWANLNPSGNKDIRIDARTVATTFEVESQSE